MIFPLQDQRCLQTSEEPCLFHIAVHRWGRPKAPTPTEAAETPLAPNVSRSSAACCRGRIVKWRPIDATHAPEYSIPAGDRLVRHGLVHAFAAILAARGLHHAGLSITHKKAPCRHGGDRAQSLPSAGHPADRGAEGWGWGGRRGNHVSSMHKRRRSFRQFWRRGAIC